VCDEIMILKEIKLSSAFVIELEKVADSRGYFARTWCKGEFADHGIPAKFRQSNTALSKLSSRNLGIGVSAITT
jgi:dTDP-4-dehydrorhamnose 3,5-epimerase